MKTITLHSDMETLYCPVTGEAILHPDLESEPGLSAAVVFVWDNVSCEFTFASPETQRRYQTILSAQCEEEDADEDLQEAFVEMIAAWNREEDSLLHLCLCGPEVMELHIAFDLQTTV